MAASYTFEDFSGAVPSLSDNPYDGLIEVCHNDPTEIQARYDTHRTARTSQQKEKLLSADFGGVVVDTILKRLEDPTIEPGFEDWRHCLVFWARPPQAVKDLIVEIQSRLKAVVPNLWVMPPTSLHMTALEITHSLTASEIDVLVDQIRPYMETITDFPSVEGHRARLVRPTLSFDAQALALSYLPAAGEESVTKRTIQDDVYTYHHLRRDLFALATGTGVKVASRYVVPSAHLTVGRFIESTDFETEDGKVNRTKVSALVKAIEEINEWLQKEYWPQEGSGIKEGGEWIVGQEKGLDFRHGALWYGNGGETVRLGKGF